VPVTPPDRRLGLLLWAQGSLVVTGAVAGPLVTDVLHYRTSPSGLDQIAGTDLVGLLAVAPLSVWVDRLAWEGTPRHPCSRWPRP
jgi:hypothetical protein